jgi:hypothetical protein
VECGSSDVGTQTIRLPKQTADKAPLFGRVILVLAKFTINIGYCPKQRRRIKLPNRNLVCLLRGMNVILTCFLDEIQLPKR